MSYEKIRIGVAPTKRGFLSMEEAKRQKDRFMRVIKEIHPEKVLLVNIDDICENGIMFSPEDTLKVIEKMKEHKIDALFLPHCDFGEEQVAATVAGTFYVPTLLWGARDERPNNHLGRGRDTQCGMFACSKVLLRYGVKFSYIFNCETESDEFRSGFDTFVRTVSILKALKGLRIAKIGSRPSSFMSVMTDEAQLLTKLGITTVPISINEVVDLTRKIANENNDEFQAYFENVTTRIDFSEISEEKAKLTAAMVLAIKNLMIRNRCQVGATECWSAFGRILGVLPCLAVGELADEGMPVACETDINGAITLAILQAVTLGESAPFFADLTIRHPENDNAELLWHCGPFPYSLKDEAVKARMVGMNEHWELKKGDITICRFDDLNGEYYLFCGEGRAIDGPETTGTYVWFETDDWRKWEERFIFGPYIHHVGGVYNKYKRAIEEAARYINNVTFDSPDHPGPKCL